MVSLGERLGSSIEKLAIEEALGVLQAKVSLAKKFSLPTSSPCAVEGRCDSSGNLSPPHSNYTSGAGHVGRAVAHAARQVGFDIKLYDDLVENQQQAREEDLDVHADMTPTEISAISTSRVSLFLSQLETTVSTNVFLRRP